VFDIRFEITERTFRQRVSGHAPTLSLEPEKEHDAAGCVS
jgi:hypothetical protein